MTQFDISVAVEITILPDRKVYIKTASVLSMLLLVRRGVDLLFVKKVNMVSSHF